MAEPRLRWLIVGAGSFGTAFAHVLAASGIGMHVTLAARSSEHVSAMRESGENARYFPGKKLPAAVALSTIDEALETSWDVIVLAVPASAFAATLERCRRCSDTFVSLAKGLDPSGERLSVVAADIIPLAQFVALSGPNIAREIVDGLPTAAVVAGTDLDRVTMVQAALGGSTFRVYANRDLIGVELAGATKNVVAIAAGIVEAAGFGTNGVSAIVTRGLYEMARYGVAQGAHLQTYLGLAGVGDLLTTCSSPFSRNKRAGQLLAQGVGAHEAQAEIGQVVEGLRTAPTMVAHGRRLGIDMRIADAVVDVAERGAPIGEVAEQVMMRPPSFEFDDDILAHMAATNPSP